MDLKLRFCESEIGYWANLYTERQREKDRVIETELIDLKSDIVKRGHMTRVELNKLARWKSYRRAGLTLENTEDFVTEITKQAFTATDDSEKLLSLTKLQGIGQPTASAILHLYDERPYPILDIHALWSVGLEWRTWGSYPFWQEYIEFCRDVANRTDVTMRELDRALWKYSASTPK